jgi:anti-sigma regulatory factor (Ser/Thr protein kinase)
MPAVREAAPGGTSSVNARRDVRLEVTAGHRELRLVRQLVGAVASLAAFDIEAIEDLRIAVDEACVWLIEHGDGNPLVIELVTVDSIIEVTGTTTRCARAPDVSQSPLEDEEISGLSAIILGASCSEYRLECVGDEARFWIRSKPPANLGE